MIDRDDFLLAKEARMRWCIDRIHHVTEGDMDRLDEWDVQDIVILNLQRAIQAAIDMAANVVAIICHDSAVRGAGPGSVKKASEYGWVQKHRYPRLPEDGYGHPQVGGLQPS